MGYLNKNGPLIPPSTENTIVDQTALKKMPSKENAPIYYVVDYWQCSMQASPILLYQRFQIISLGCTSIELIIY